MMATTATTGNLSQPQDQRLEEPHVNFNRAM